jgi:hypothetical protein
LRPLRRYGADRKQKREGGSFCVGGLVGYMLMNNMISIYDDHC